MEREAVPACQGESCVCQLVSARHLAAELMQGGRHQERRGFAEWMRAASGIGEGLLAVGKGAVCITEMPEDTTEISVAGHPVVIPVDRRRRAIAVRVIKSDPALEMITGSRQFSEPEQINSDQGMGIA